MKSVSNNNKPAKRAPGPGRPKGMQNKATKASRELIALILDEEMPNIKTALAKVRKRYPTRYLDLLIRLMEFAVPKLSRTELVGSTSSHHSLNVIVQDEETKNNLELLHCKTG